LLRVGVSVLVLVLEAEKAALPIPYRQVLGTLVKVKFASRSLHSWKIAVWLAAPVPIPIDIIQIFITPLASGNFAQTSALALISSMLFINRDAGLTSGN